MKYPFHVETLKTKKFTMDFAVFGSGEQKLVILPGISLHPVMSYAVTVARDYALFGAAYTVYLFDRIKNMPDGYSVEAMSDDTAVAMRLLGISGAYVFGASQGGMMALCLAEKYPELVKKAAVASSMLKNNEISYAFLSRLRELAAAGRKEELNRIITKIINIFCHYNRNQITDLPCLNTAKQ